MESKNFVYVIRTYLSVPCRLLWKKKKLVGIRLSKTSEPGFESREGQRSKAHFLTPFGSVDVAVTRLS